jgi:hypothetical protein
MAGFQAIPTRCGRPAGRPGEGASPQRHRFFQEGLGTVILADRFVDVCQAIADIQMLRMSLQQVLKDGQRRWRLARFPQARSRYRNAR